ncbi:hypothetical protein ABPG75_012171 [Micractinium tetrahymenae]
MPVWPRPKRSRAVALDAAPFFRLGPEELATLEYLQEQVGMSEAEAEQAVAQMCTFYMGWQQRSKPLVFSFEKQVKPVADLLGSLPGADLKRIISACPSLLVKAPAADLERRLQRLCTWLGLTQAEQAQVLNKSPHTLFTGNLDKRIFPFLSRLEGLGFRRAEVKAMVLRLPNFLLYSVAKLNERIRWLEAIGMSPADVRTVLWKFPTVVCHTPGACVVGMQWLLHLGVPDKDCTTIIRRLPAVITYSSQKRRRFLDFMRGELGLDNAAIARIVRHTPDTLGRTVERLRSNVAGLESFGMRKDQVQRLIVANPSVLRLDITSPTYSNKLRYLKEGLQPENPVETVVTYPFYLSYRLDRIVLRTEYLKFIGGSISSLAAWLAMSEKRFCEEWAGTSVAQFHAWAAEWRHSPEGKHWLGLASKRNSLMHKRRVLLEATADAASDQAAREAIEEEAEQAEEHARRQREAQRLFQEQAAQAAEDRRGQQQQSSEGQALEELELELQRQAAEAEQSAQHWEQQAERLRRLARAVNSEQQQLAEQTG